MCKPQHVQQLLYLASFLSVKITRFYLLKGLKASLLWVHCFCRTVHRYSDVAVTTHTFFLDRSWINFEDPIETRYPLGSGGVLLDDIINHPQMDSNQ